MNTLATVLTGLNCHVERDALDAAVENRFKLIRGSFAFVERDDKHPDCFFGYCYDGNRTQGSELGWRLRQNFGALDPKEIERGIHDSRIAATFHDAADTEYYYRHEKDWGRE